MGTMIFDPIWGRKSHVDPRCELMHVISGNVDLAIGRQRCTAGPGDTRLVPAGTPHRDAFDVGKGLKVFMVFFDWAPAAEYFRLVNNDVMQRMSAPRREDLSRIVERLRVDVLGDSVSDRLVVESRLLTVLLLALREAAAGARRPAESAGRGRERRQTLMRDARRFLQEHYNEVISLDDIARALNVSAFHLSHVFSEESDFTLFHYLTALRMEKARELLRGGLKVAAVAREVGYGDGNYFAKAFRRHFGVSPRELRRR